MLIPFRSADDESLVEPEVELDSIFGASKGIEGYSFGTYWSSASFPVETF